MKILTTILDVATVFLRLLEAEGRILKRAVMKVGWALAFVGVASLLDHFDGVTAKDALEYLTLQSH